MNILGISNGETSSAVLLVDGKFIAAASEERFSRKKMDESFPLKSIEFVLNWSNLKKKDIDIVSYAWSKGFPEDSLVYQFENLNKLNEEERKIFFERLKVEQSTDLPIRDEFWSYIKSKQGFSSAIIEDYYHHEAHALSACMLSPFDNCAVLTCDGRGDYESLTFSTYDKSKHKLTKLYSSSSSDSLGFFYGRITGLLGFKPCRHEGKITGLSAHGDPNQASELMNKMISYDGKNIYSKLGEFYRPFYENYSNKLISEINKYSKEDISAAAQDHLEKILSSFLYDQYKKNNLFGLPLCLSGGVFGNVKLNAKLRDTEGVSGIFVQPQMGDGGLAFGAVCGTLLKRNLYPEPLISMSLGPYAGNIKSLRSKYDSNGYDFQKYDQFELIDIIVDHLNKGKVVGLVRGRMEFGPRALCNRSILFKTSDNTCNDWLNKRMSRTEFMPFAPVITSENAKIYLDPFNENDRSLWFMTATVNVSEIFKKKCPAVTHIDGTARPQIISKTNDLWLWNLLNKWEQLTGEPSLINTSFNRHEEPIICTYEEAFSNLKEGVVDILVLDEWIILKSDNIN